MSNLTRREFIKTTSMAALAFAAVGLPLGDKVFAADNCTVKTRYGTFNGFVDEIGVKTWLGIPYAQPPVGKLRWQPTQPLKPSNKTRDAKKFGASAIQEDDELEKSSENLQSEDCLTLNIWKRSDKKICPLCSSFTAEASCTAALLNRFITEIILRRRVMSLSSVVTIG